MMDFLNAPAVAQPADDAALDFAAFLQPAQPAQEPPGEAPMEWTTPETLQRRDEIVALEEEGLRIVLRLKKGESPAETIMKAVISNANASPITDFSMQAAVPKYMKLQMKPISDPVIPANEEDVSTQLLRVRNNAQGEVSVQRSDEERNLRC